MKKYKLDIIIIAIIGLVSIIGIILLNTTAKYDNLTAIVYHNDEEILKIDLYTLDKDTTYIVHGEISDVTILANKNGVKIIESDCYDHTCINQGLITNTNQSITCIPNKIYIKLLGNDDMDVIV